MNIPKFFNLKAQLIFGKPKAFDSVNETIDKFGLDAFTSSQLFELMTIFNSMVVDPRRVDSYLDEFVQDPVKKYDLKDGPLSDVEKHLKLLLSVRGTNGRTLDEMMDALDYVSDVGYTSPSSMELLQKFILQGVFRYLEPNDAHYILTRFIEDATHDSYQLIESAFNNGALELLSPTLRKDILVYLENPGFTPCAETEIPDRYPAIATAIKTIDSIAVVHTNTEAMGNVQFSLLKHRLKSMTPKSFENLTVILRREGIDIFSRDQITKAMLICSEADRNEKFAQHFMNEAIEKGAIQRMDPSAVYIFVQNLFMKFDLRSFGVIANAANHGAVNQMGPRLAMTAMVHFRFSMPSFNGKGKHPSSALPLTAMIENGGLDVLNERRSFDSFFANADSFSNEDFHAAYGTALALNVGRSQSLGDSAPELLG